MTAKSDAGIGPIDRASLPTHTFDWGATKWLVSPATTPGARLTFGEVLVLPGQGHSRHNHPDAEEVLYVLSGEGEQVVDDGEPFPFRAGDVLYIPAGAFHSTLNTGWEPMRLIALYNPGGAERALAELPDYQETPAGALPEWRRAARG
ncbi:MAG: cupin domain-containing protein [Thermomicrobiales bacterium]|nr:cupin domain-containing protein [Thermomicrobiales bacterium]